MVDLLSDSTSLIQNYIDEAHEESRKRHLRESSVIDRLVIELKKGDYPIQQIVVPKETSLTLFSKDRARLLFIGKRNRPLFVLQENCELILNEKLEIYYNSNNLQEVMNLMVRFPKSSRVEISNGVKFSIFSYKAQT